MSVRGRPLVVVAGMIAGDPHQGGATWAVMQYVIALDRLGYDVVVVDPLPAGPIRPEVLAYFRELCATFGLAGRAALLPVDGDPHGVTLDELHAVVRRATAVVNLSGRWRDHDLIGKIPVRIYVDLDPGFTQVWHDQGADVGLADHTYHVTVGAGVNNPESPLPSSQITWHAILPPVVLDQWPVCRPPDEPRLTTIANWRSYGPVEHGGVRYGQKVHAFRSLEALPACSAVPLSVALSIHSGDEADRDRLIEAGWDLLDPIQTAGSPDQYRAFVRTSWGEIGIAKTGYITGRTAWVSDRSACYLACGHPVIAQDTGLGEVLPIGLGIVAFGDVEEAVDAIARVRSDYSRHRAAARAIAETHLDARRVVGRMMTDALS